MADKKFLVNVIVDGDQKVNGTIKGGFNLLWNGDSFNAGNADASTVTYQPSDGISSITDLGLITIGWVNTTKYNGQTLQGCVGGEVIKKGRLVHLSTNGRWLLTDADQPNLSTSLLGIALDDATDGSSLAVLLDGIIIASQHAQAGAAIVGKPLYIQTSAIGTPGSVTEVAPTTSGETVRLIGHNLADITGGVIIRFQPDNTWLEL